MNTETGASTLALRPAGDGGSASTARRQPSPHSRSPSSLSIPNGRQHQHHGTNTSTSSIHTHSAAPSISSRAHSQKSSVSDVGINLHQQQPQQPPQIQTSQLVQHQYQQYHQQQQQYHHQLMSQRSQHVKHNQPFSQRGLRKVRTQYPRDSTENHVEYILVASFDIDRGSVMEHQYPGPISGDEHMLAELMLPDQAHVRSQDWTIFFLHKDTTEDEEGKEEGKKKKKKRKKDRIVVGNGDASEAATNREGSGEDEDEDEDETDDEDDDTSDDDSGSEGPPLIYVLNLVNTKQDNSAKRGAVVKAMAICTRHSFLHIYKPLLLLALEEYFRTPKPETLASLFNAANSMDLSLLPKLSLSERFILQHSDAKDLFVEKFEHLIQQRMREDAEALQGQQHQQSADDWGAPPPRYKVPRDTHESESHVYYNGIPVPVKVPTATSAEMVGDFSLIKLIQMFSAPHTSSPQPFTLHPHLTTSGPLTHPIIVLVNALLTQKRIIFLGHNRPSGEVAEVVLAACALASGDILRGFTRYAFPYTDLTKIDDLLEVPGFIAGVTNPAFAYKAEWWDVLCDISAGRIKISSKIEPAPVTDGLRFFQQQQQQFQQQHQSTLANGKDSSGTGSAGSGAGGSGGGTGAAAMSANDATQDNAFMESLLQSIASRHGENAIRSRWRDWISKFTRIAAAFEETVYGASALYIAGPETAAAAAAASAAASVGGSGASGSGKSGDGDFGVSGHGYVWPDEASRQRELAGNANRVEAWRSTRSYYNYVQDLAYMYTKRPVKGLDFMHQHDRLSKLKLSHEQSAAIYMALAAAVDWGVPDDEVARSASKSRRRKSMGSGNTGSVVGAGKSDDDGDEYEIIATDTDSGNLDKGGSGSVGGSSGGGGAGAGEGPTDGGTSSKNPSPQKSNKRKANRGSGDDGKSGISGGSTKSARASSVSHRRHRPWRYDIINQLLSVVAESNAGLFYVSLGLFHPKLEVRNAVVTLLDRLVDHPAGRHFWAGLGRFAKLAYIRIKRSMEAAAAGAAAAAAGNNGAGNNGGRVGSEGSGVEVGNGGGGGGGRVRGGSGNSGSGSGGGGGGRMS